MRRLLLCLALPLLLGTCQTNPHTGRSQLLLFSDQEMSQMGSQAYLEMTGPQSGAKVITDPRYAGPLQEVGQALAVVGNDYLRKERKPEYQWEFKLIDDPKTVNAWCLPGGKIAFYTAIYPILEDSNGMAIVMGHEAMHAILEHGNERMSQNLTTQAVMAAAAVGFSNTKNGDYIVAALGAGATVGFLLPYSRKHESEADKQGLYLAAKAGYDPEAAVAVWTRMAELSKGARPPEFLSTHPDPLNRIKNMEKWMPKAKEYYAASQKKPNRKLAMPPGVGANK
jgi:predicted Zn-dependent protease